MSLIQVIYRIRERINLRLFYHRAFALQLLQVLSIFVSLTAIGSIIFYYGFPATRESFEITYLIIKGSFLFYIIKYLLRIFYDFSPVQHIRNTWFEGLLMLTLILIGIIRELTGVNLWTWFLNTIEIPGTEGYYILFIQVYFLLIVAMELGKASSMISNLNLGPAQLLTLSFVILILSGTGLLMLPEMVNGPKISFIDALFTSTSASCVTGLTVLDTATFFSLKGKTIILILIQLGGINIISFATFFTTFYKNQSGLKYNSLLKNLMDTENVSDSRQILRKILFFSLSIELAGAIAIFFSWGNDIHFIGFGQKVFYSVFHSVSAFNNAGFALFTQNLFEASIRHAYFLQITIALLIILGGLGFSVLQDVFSIKRNRERMKLHWKSLQIGSKVAIYTSASLILLGMILFFFLEFNHSLKEFGLGGKIVQAFFQSVTARTAGYNTVDFSIISQPALIMIMFLMLVGASPGSTGGGIKTNTFAIIFNSAFATIRGKKHIEMYRHSIPFSLVDKAYSILLFSLSLIFISTFLLSIFEPGFDFIQLLFEEISAFGTVGLSTGITAQFGNSGKLILIITMFVGRIGTITLALAISKKVFFTRYKYSEANLPIG
jgi:trk system potassium uptake protein TrkH